MTHHALSSDSAHQPSIKIPTYEITSQENIEIIHQQSLKILRTVSISSVDKGTLCLQIFRVGAIMTY